MLELFGLGGSGRGGGESTDSCLVAVLPDVCFGQNFFFDVFGFGLSNLTFSAAFLCCSTSELMAPCSTAVSYYQSDYIQNSKSHFILFHKRLKHFISAFLTHSLCILQFLYI